MSGVKPKFIPKQKAVKKEPVEEPGSTSEKTAASGSKSVKDAGSGSGSSDSTRKRSSGRNNSSSGGRGGGRGGRGRGKGRGSFSDNAMMGASFFTGDSGRNTSKPEVKMKVIKDKKNIKTKGKGGDDTGDKEIQEGSKRSSQPLGEQDDDGDMVLVDSDEEELSVLKGNKDQPVAVIVKKEGKSTGSKSSKNGPIDVDNDSDMEMDDGDGFDFGEDSSVDDDTDDENDIEQNIVGLADTDWINKKYNPGMPITFATASNYTDDSVLNNKKPLFPALEDPRWEEESIFLIQMPTDLALKKRGEIFEDDIIYQGVQKVQSETEANTKSNSSNKDNGSDKDKEMDVKKKCDEMDVDEFKSLNLAKKTGQIGKLQLLDNGKVLLQCDDGRSYEIHSGINSHFGQHLFSVDLDEHMEGLGIDAPEDGSALPVELEERHKARFEHRQQVKKALDDDEDTNYRKGRRVIDDDESPEDEAEEARLEQEWNKFKTEGDESFDGDLYMLGDITQKWVITPCFDIGSSAKDLMRPTPIDPLANAIVESNGEVCIKTEIS